MKPIICIYLTNTIARDDLAVVFIQTSFFEMRITLVGNAYDETIQAKIMGGLSHSPTDLGAGLFGCIAHQFMWVRVQDFQFGQSRLRLSADRAQSECSLPSNSPFRVLERSGQRCNQNPTV